MATEDSKTVECSMADTVHEQIQGFLEAGGFELSSPWRLVEGAAQVVERLRVHREEGTPLRPDVYLFPSSTYRSFRKVTGFYHFFELDRIKLVALTKTDSPYYGKHPGEIFDLAIKKCGPLARLGWNIFISWNDDYLAFGVMRRTFGLVLMPAEESLRALTKASPFLLVRQISENVVELRGPSGARQVLRFSGLHSSGNPRVEQMRQCVIQLVASGITPAPLRQKVHALFETILREAIIFGEGFLIGVTAYRPGNQDGNWAWKQFPVMDSSISDGDYFKIWPVSLHYKVKMFESSLRPKVGKTGPELRKSIERSVDLYAQLQAWANLIPMMLAADGMTLFDTLGQTLGFGVFVGDVEEPKVRKYPIGLRRGGGARRRAFFNLCNLVDKGALVGAYYQSQDGDVEWYGPGLDQQFSSRSRSSRSP